LFYFVYLLFPYLSLDLVCCEKTTVEAEVMEEVVTVEAEVMDGAEEVVTEVMDGVEAEDGAEDGVEDRMR
jgi:hypothetical protein